ncbi:MAG TPA: hypothetical protein VLE27_08845 [Thermoanaerobaculia bacterium]|nr:hypothetical protein [Thermoanaerobaculia bacterium]
MRSVLAGCALLGLLAGCGGERPPRRLPFPSFEPRSPFPELADAGAVKPAEESAFARALGSGQAREADGEAPRQSLPLGNGLAGELPVAGWTWAAGPGLTLAVHRGPAAADALIWAEPFSAGMLTHPSQEVLRFHLAIHLGARAAGRGLGFRPGPGEATGWRWVGRAPQGVTVRLGRKSGLWSESPASLWTGSVTDANEAAGAHLAILCAGASCPVAEDLAAFLGSIRVGEPGRLARLRDSQGSPADLAREVGIEILAPTTLRQPSP